MLALSAYLSYGLFAARQDDSQLLAQTRAACQQVQGAGAGGRITWVAECGRTIEQLEAAAAGTSLGFGIRRADKDIEQLKRSEEHTPELQSLMRISYTVFCLTKKQ